MIGLIWAEAQGKVIGRDGVMPWHLPEDLAHFREITIGCPVIMGRKTWESLPQSFRPLPGRTNIVVTRNPDWSAEGAHAVGSLPDAIERARAASEAVWVIGGGDLFAQALMIADRIELTEINAEIAGDSFAPEIPEDWEQSQREPTSGWFSSSAGLDYRFLSFTRSLTR